MDKERDEYMNDTDFEEVVNRYEDMLKDNRKLFFDVHEFENIIDFYLDINNSSQALKAAIIAHEQHPTSLAIQIKKAHILLNKGNPKQALKILTRIERIETTNSEIYELKGTAHALLGSIKEAEKYFDLAVDKAIDNKDEILYSIALSFEQINEFELSLKYLQQALKINPENLSVIYDLAYTYERQGNLNKSIDYYKFYLEKDPFADSVWFNIGVVYNKKEDYEKAIEAYDFAIAINEHYSTAYFNKANTLANVEQYDKAIEIYKEFIEIENDNVQAYCYIGECYEKKEDWINATRNYQQALSIDSLFPDAWFGMGMIAFFQKDYSESLQLTKKAISLDEENPEYWFSIGKINLKLGNTEDAYIAYKKVTEYDPYDYESWLNRSEILYKTININEAIGLLKKAYEYTFDIALINYRLAAFYFIKKDIQTASHYLKKALTLNSSEISDFFKFFPQGGINKDVKALINQYIDTKKSNHERPLLND